ncbi:hypothetical protein BDV11DRAFT_9324 [Aspergillus similis]
MERASLSLPLSFSQSGVHLSAPAKFHWAHLYENGRPLQPRARLHLSATQVLISPNSRTRLPPSTPNYFRLSIFS